MTLFNFARPTGRPALEAWGLARCPERELARLEPLLERLSKLFTDARPESYDSYLEDADTLTAYALYYAPQTYARTEAALNGILDRLPAFPERPLRILDLGCGIGSAAMAAYDVLKARYGHAPEVTCMDWSEHALTAAKELLPTAQICKGDLRTFQPEGTYDIILSSFAFNEAFPKLTSAEAALRQLATHLTPDAPSFVLLLEPAHRANAPRLTALRSALMRDYPLYAPCPHTRLCPMVPTQDGICHDVRRYKPDRATILLNRKLQRTIADIKYALLAFGRADGPQAEGCNHNEFLRMVGPMDKAKGVLTCRVCMGDGALRRLEIPSAALDADRRHELLSRERGDCAWLDGALDVRKCLEGGTIQRTADLRFVDEAPLTLDDLEDFSFSI